MLLIFDLDDTLVDTTGSIAKPLLKKSLQKMVECGLVVPDFDTALSMLHRLYSSGEMGIYEFVELFDGTEEIAQIGIDVVYRPDNWDEPIQTSDGAQEVLSALAIDHKLALVTMGNEKVQLKKLEVCGLDASLFSKVCVTPRKKGEVYEQIVSELGFSFDHTIVCGDRIANDLTPAKQLGMKTIHMRQGRGLGNTGLKRDVDYTILRLQELASIVKRFA